MFIYLSLMIKMAVLVTHFLLIYNLR